VARGPAISKKSATGAQRPSVPMRIKQFLIEAWLELQKVLWPTKPEAIRLTLVVLGVIAVVALFVYIIDIVLSQLSGPLFNLGPTK
jgi:preprotein translocase SecE subunit